MDGSIRLGNKENGEISRENSLFTDTEHFLWFFRQYIKGLSDFFRELSEQEKERIKGFEASENKADPKQEARVSGKAASKR